MTPPAAPSRLLRFLDQPLVHEDGSLSSFLYTLIVAVTLTAGLWALAIAFLVGPKWRGGP